MHNLIDREALGKKIRELRENNGLSKSQLAKALGCTPKHIGNIEKCNAGLSIDALVGLANALEVTPDILLKESLNNRKDIRLLEYELIISDCTEGEIEVLIEMARIMKVKRKLLGEENERK